MKTSPKFPTSFFQTNLFNYSICFLILFLSYQTKAQTFQKIYGDASKNVYTKIIKDGSHYFAIGWFETSSGTQLAIVSRMDNQGTLICDIKLDIASVWYDAVLTSAGQLLVVGRASNADSTGNSIMGLVTTIGAGTSCNYLWVKRYSEPNKDFFKRVVKNPVAQVNFYPFYVLGTQTDLSNPPNTDVVLLQMNAAGTINSKKIIHTSGNDEFYLDLEALSNGDILLAGNQGVGAFGKGLIYKLDNQGNTITGVQIPQMNFWDIAKNSVGNMIYAAGYEYINVTTSSIHIMKFDTDLLLLWDVVIPQLTNVNQVWDGGAGFLYVTGTKDINGVNTNVIIKMQDDGQAVSWVKYYNASTISTLGSLWHMPATNEMAYTNGGVLPNGFGNYDAFLAVSNLELDNCFVSSDMVSLTTANPFPEGPLLPISDSVATPTGVNLMYFSAVWDEMEVCNNTPCTDSLAFVNTAANVQTNGTLGNCMLHFEATGLDSCMEITYNWGDNPSSIDGPYGNNIPVWHTYAAQGTYTICYTIQEVDSDGTICWVYENCEEVFVLCDSCCISFDNFCQNLDNEISISVDNDSCKATVNIGNLPDCDYIEYIDWGTNPSQISQGPFTSGSMAMNVYSGSGTYIISYLAIELDDNGFICFEKIVNDTITVVCDSCCTSFDDFCQNLDNEISISINNDSCKAIVNIGNIPDCDYIEYIDWGTNPSTISQGPFPPGSMAMNVYSGSGTYVISYLAIELDDNGFICFEKIVNDTITVVCDSCCTSFDDFCQNLDNEISIAIDNDSCKATVNIGNIPDCDYIEYIDWGTNPPQISQGPFPPGSMAMNVYFASGTYIISYLAIELDDNGFICFEKLINDTIILNCNIIAVDNLQESQAFSVFPNPTTGNVTVQFFQPAIKGILLQVIDLTGRLLFEKPVKIGEKMQTLDAKSLPQGIYFVQVISNGKILAADKLVKQ